MCQTDAFTPVFLLRRNAGATQHSAEFLFSEKVGNEDAHYEYFLLT